MFAYVYYIIYKKFAKVPVSYIKGFSPANETDFKEGAPYMVFWSWELRRLQGNLEILQELKGTDVPEKTVWHKERGEGFYQAFILRMNESVRELQESVDKKRPSVPATRQAVEESDSTEDDANHLVDNTQSLQTCPKSLENSRLQQKRLNQQKLKNQNLAKRNEMQQILRDAKKQRKNLFEENVYHNAAVTERHNDTQLSLGNLSTQYAHVTPLLPLQSPKYEPQFFEASELQLLSRKDSFQDGCPSNMEHEQLSTKYDRLKADYEQLNEEVETLRKLNYCLQNQLLKAKENSAEQDTRSQLIATHTLQSDVLPSDEAVNLGEDVFIQRHSWLEIQALTCIKKFTKCLAVAIWGTEVLGKRSVMGQACRNVNGPKKTLDDGSTQIATVHRQAKPPLTPKKLAIISRQMRIFMENQNFKQEDINKHISLRNRYISDKIQNVCEMKKKLK